MTLEDNGNYKDIVGQLRDVSKIETGLLYSRRLMLNQAADEIERLREQVRTANDNSARYCQEIERLSTPPTEERDIRNSALEKIHRRAQVAEGVYLSVKHDLEMWLHTLSGRGGLDTWLFRFALRHMEKKVRKAEERFSALKADAKIRGAGFQKTRSV